MKPLPFNNKFVTKIRSFVQHYNHELYWKRRAIVIDPNNKKNVILKLYYLFYIKRADAFNNASFGTNINSGSVFLSPPKLPHGLNGIIVGHDLKIGRNCTIFQQVTIMHGGGDYWR